MSLANDLNKIDTDLKQVKTDTNTALSEKGSTGVNTLSELPLAIRNIPSSSYILPVATADTLGGVKVGENLSITPEGVLSAIGGGGSGGGERPWELFKEVLIEKKTTDWILGDKWHPSELDDKKYTELFVKIEYKASVVKSAYITINSVSGGDSRIFPSSMAFGSQTRDKLFWDADFYHVHFIAPEFNKCEAVHGNTNDDFLTKIMPADENDTLKKGSYIWLFRIATAILEAGSKIIVWGR